LGIIGPNGGGKTTLLKVILGLVKPSQGQVRVFGEVTEKNRRYVGYVPQYSHFDRDFPINVEEVVLMGRLGHTGCFHQYREEDKTRVREALELMEMWDMKNMQIGTLSGGERQRVYIARALVMEPQLLLLDEPTASIDKPMQTEFYDLLHDLKSKMAIVLVTHDIGVISTHVDTIACLNRKLIYHGGKEITPEVLEALYQCPVDLLAHGIPHRVMKEHA
jgi:zinc transport system ATP-binding protein